MERPPSTRVDDRDVAIVGIGCRFPGRANSPDEFWRLLEKGFDAIAEPPPSRVAFLEAFDPDPKTPGHDLAHARGGFLERIGSASTRSSWDLAARGGVHQCTAAPDARGVLGGTRGCRHRAA